MKTKIDPENIPQVGKQLQQFVERIERLEETKSGLAADVRDLYTQAKSAGFDTKAMRQVIRRRKMERNQVDEEDNLVHLYEQSLETA